MAKICPNCEKENPSAANYCMFCNTQLIEEEQLSEEDKLRKKIAELAEQKELLKQAKELEKNKLEKELQETKKKQKEITEQSEKNLPPFFQKPTQPPTLTPSNSTSNTGKVILIAVLIVVAMVVFGGIYYNNVYLPSKIDREAQRYYSLVNLNFRSSKEAGGEYNKIGSIPYGAELITYEYDSEWSYVKYKDDSGNSKKGYVSSAFILNKGDFIRLNSIWGDTESKECASTAKCRLALLNYFKENGYIGKISSDVLTETFSSFSATNENQWQIFCRDVNSKPNNVSYPKLYNKNSKFTDFAVIIKNINTGERRLLLFYFDDDETPHLYYSEPVYSSGYIVNIENINGVIYTKYSE